MQTFPFFGVQPVLLDENGKEIRGPGEGYLVFSRPWPGMMRTLFGNHDRFETTYFKKFPGYYCTGDGKLYFYRYFITFYFKVVNMKFLQSPIAGKSIHIRTAIYIN